MLLNILKKQYILIMDTPLQPVKIIIDNFLENEKSGSNPQFPKNELYENFLDHHKDQLSKYKEDDRLVYLFNSIKSEIRDEELAIKYVLILYYFL